MNAERGRRTNRISTVSHGVWLGFSFSRLSIEHLCISWMYSGVATGVFMALLVIVLLHGIAQALLQVCIVCKVHCAVNHNMLRLLRKLAGVDNGW
jgi:hypothetical protein